MPETKKQMSEAKKQVSDEKKKAFEELIPSEGLICDPETGVCEIPGPAAQPPSATKATPERGDR